jgi:5'-nucleotidase
MLVAAACSVHGDAAANGASEVSIGDGGTASLEAGSASGDGASSAGLVNVQILAFNDFHGNLMPPSPTNGAVLAKSGDPVVAGASPVDNGDGTETVQAGGIAYFAAHLAALRAQNPNTLVVSSGDLTGAAPLLSNAYADEPTVELMNTIGIDLEAVGNHDFDNGAPGVLRLQNGGCNPATDVDAGFGELGSCEIAPTFPGATFEYLAANVNVVNASTADIPTGGPTTGTLFPPYAIKTVGGAKIAFIGMTLSGTPSIVSGGLPGLQFQDEVATANALVPVLQAQNVDAIVVLLHQGGFQTGTYNDCVNLQGSEIERIAMGLDPAISLIHSAHTHVAYNCTINGRPVAQAASFGRIITQYALAIDTTNHKVQSVRATNIPVTRDVAPDSTIQPLVASYLADLAPLADTVVGNISGDITKSPLPSGEAPLGDAITDGMLWAANQYVSANAGSFPDSDQRVDVAFTNIGGIRDGLFYDTSGFIARPDGTALPKGEVTYLQTQAIEPFGDIENIVECTGAQIIAAVQQNTYVGGLQVLQQSGLTYSWSASAAQDGGMGAADPASFAIVGADGTSKPLDANAKYYVAGLTFFTTGGDGYTAFQACTQVATVGVDLDIFDSYLTQNTSAANPLPVPAGNRITMTCGGSPCDDAGAGSP